MCAPPLAVLHYVQNKNSSGLVSAPSTLHPLPPALYHGECLLSGAHTINPTEDRTLKCKLNFFAATLPTTHKRKALTHRVYSFLAFVCSDFIASYTSFLEGCRRYVSEPPLWHQGTGTVRTIFSGRRPAVELLCLRYSCLLRQNKRSERRNIVWCSKHPNMGVCSTKSFGMWL